MLTFIAGSITAFIIILRFLKQVVSALKAPYRFFKEQSQSARDSAIIRKEVTLNGGGSLKDAVIRIEMRISVTEQEQRAVDSDAQHAIFRSDETGRCFWVNPAYCKLVDRQLSEITGNGWESYIHWEDREHILTEWHKAVIGEREFEMQYRLNDNRAVNVKAHPLRHPLTGKLLGYRGSVRLIEPPKL